MTPANSTPAPPSRRPAASVAAIHGPLSRVSMPITTRAASPGDCSRRDSASACPTANIVRLSSGASPATARIPSVPNIFRISKASTARKPRASTSIAAITGRSSCYAASAFSVVDRLGAAFIAYSHSSQAPYGASSRHSTSARIVPAASRAVIASPAATSPGDRNSRPSGPNTSA